MYIVPIAMHNRGSGLKQVWALLERNGNHLISLDVSEEGPELAAKGFAELNGLSLIKGPVHVNGLVFLSVDTRTTDFSNFYSWREVAPGTVPQKEVWRQFVWAPDSLNVNTFLNEIQIGEPNHTVYSVLNTYLKTCQ